MADSYVPLSLLEEVDDFGAAASWTVILQLARLSPGTFYPMLHSMGIKGYLRSREKKSGRSVRRLYRATSRGTKALDEVKGKFKELVGELFEGR